MQHFGLILLQVKMPVVHVYINKTGINVTDEGMYGSM